MRCRRGHDYHLTADTQSCPRCERRKFVVAGVVVAVWLVGIACWLVYLLSVLR